MVNHFVKKLYNKFFDRAYFSQKLSYSQCGEDLIIDFLFSWVLDVKKPSFLDIGAHHPYNFNNTFLFYKRGCRGVNVEPDPALFTYFNKMRPSDKNINKGVGFEPAITSAPFYVMSSRAMNTFSKEGAEEMISNGSFQLEEIIEIPLVDINQLLEAYFPLGAPDLLSLDVEGLDLEILRRLDFARWSPKVICVETIMFNDKMVIEKNTAIPDLLAKKGYFVYADTSINTIFAQQSSFSKNR